MNIKIEKLTNKDSIYFNTICDWNYNWWGLDYKKEYVVDFMSRCLNEDKIPKTYIALYDDKVVGMYQIAMEDDLNTRPDYYPWLINVYVDEQHRGKGICKLLVEHSKETFKQLGFGKVYLHSKHINLYEKYGWKYLEEATTLNGEIKRIYYLDIDEDSK